MNQILTSVDKLNGNDTQEAKQRILLESSLDAWIISTNQSFSQEITTPLSRFKNLRSQIISGFEFETHLGSNRPELPELLLLDANEPWQRYLEPLQQLQLTEEPTVILFGDAEDIKNMRAAIKHGIKDYIPLPINFSELQAALQVTAQKKAEQAERANIHVILNAKGGMGA